MFFYIYFALLIFTATNQAYVSNSFFLCFLSYMQQDNNRGSPMMLVKLYPYMSDDQKQLIDSACFGGLLNCRCSQLFPELCQWLLDCFDAETSELVFPGRGRIPVTEAVVHRVMGIPRGSNVIRCEIDAPATSFMLNEFGVAKSSQPKISELFNSLKMNKNANRKYLRTWTIFAACSVITPTFSTKVSPRLYPAVIDSRKIREQNWCELLIRILKQSKQSDAKDHSFKPCLTFLMVSFLIFLKYHSICLFLASFSSSSYYHHLAV